MEYECGEQKSLFTSKRVLKGSKKDKMLDKLFQWTYQEYFDDADSKNKFDHKSYVDLEMKKQEGGGKMFPKTRMENSLGELTKKFMYLVRDANGLRIDLNVTSE